MLPHYPTYLAITYSIITEEEDATFLIKKSKSGDFGAESRLTKPETIPRRRLHLGGVLCSIQSAINCTAKNNEVCEIVILYIRLSLLCIPFPRATHHQPLFQE